MSHNVTQRSNGSYEMAYVGERTWWGGGNELLPGQPIEKWLVAAGMDWKVQRAKVRYPVAQGATPDAFMEWPDKHVLFRSDTKAPLGMVSDHFKVVQPKQVLEFFRDLCASNKFMLETAGTLRGGAIYWAMAKIHEDAEVCLGDKMKGYIMVSTACDGSRRTVSKNTSVRVVCNNTLDMADQEKGMREVCVSHRSVFDEKEVKTDLSIAREAFHDFMVSARKLAARKLTRPEAVDLTLRLLGGDGYQEFTTIERDEVLSGKHAQAIATLYSGTAKGSNLPSAKGTAWGYVNAVTEYVDHYFPARSVDNRLNSAWFGAGERLKNDAFRKALELVPA